MYGVDFGIKILVILYKIIVEFLFCYVCFVSGFVKIVMGVVVVFGC